MPRTSTIVRSAFCTLFALTAVAAFAQEPAPPDPPPQGPETREPRGPDELYQPLPDDGLFEGVPPTETFKAVVLRAPLPGGGDEPELELPRWAGIAAGGLRLVLEQKLDYLPHVHTERNVRRIARYMPRLRSSDVPRPDEEFTRGKPLPALEQAARTFGSDYVFLFSYRLAIDDEPALAALICYRRGEGIERAVKVELNRPDGDNLITTFEAAVEEVTAHVGAIESDDGIIRVAHAPVPRLVRKDCTLEHFVAMRHALEQGELTEAWIAWEDLKELEPHNGRAALWGMEIFRALSDQQMEEAHAEVFKQRSIRAGVDALTHVPNDIMLRGRLCWNAYIFHGREEWALAGLRQALRIQPYNIDLLEWYVQAQFYWEQDSSVQANWLRERALGKLKDGRIEFALGNIYFGALRFEDGIEWYRKALEYAPDEHGFHLNLSMCATYEAEQLMRIATPGPDGDPARELASELFYMAADHMWKAIQLDPLETEYTFDFFLRALTHNFTHLPHAQQDLDRLFLVWAARDGMASASRTARLERLAGPLLQLQRPASRAAAREAKPGDEYFELHLMARLHFSVRENRPKETVHCLWLMKELGLRPDVYHVFMRAFAPLVNDYQPPDDQD